MARVLRERLTGCPLHEVRERLAADPELVRGSAVRIVARAAAESWSRRVSTPLYRTGIPHIAGQPEFATAGRLGPILQVIENGPPLDRLMVTGVEGQVAVRVGVDEDRALAGCSLVSFALPGSIRGAVGVLGTRAHGLRARVRRGGRGRQPRRRPAAILTAPDPDPPVSSPDRMDGIDVEDDDALPVPTAPESASAPVGPPTAAEPDAAAEPPAAAAAAPDAPGAAGETRRCCATDGCGPRPTCRTTAAARSASVEETRRHAEESVMLEIIAALDDLERALDAAPGEGTSAAWAEGVRLVAQHLRDSLARRGVTVVDPAGESFDPTFHDALLELPAPDGVAPGTVAPGGAEGLPSRRARAARGARRGGAGRRRGGVSA